MSMAIFNSFLYVYQRVNMVVFLRWPAGFLSEDTPWMPWMPWITGPGVPKKKPVSYGFSCWDCRSWTAFGFHGCPSVMDGWYGWFDGVFLQHLLFLLVKMAFFPQDHRDSFILCLFNHQKCWSKSLIFARLILMLGSWIMLNPHVCHYSELVATIQTKSEKTHIHNTHTYIYIPTYIYILYIHSYNIRFLIYIYIHIHS